MIQRIPVEECTIKFGQWISIFSFLACSKVWIPATKCPPFHIYLLVVLFASSLLISYCRSIWESNGIMAKHAFILVIARPIGLGFILSKKAQNPYTVLPSKQYLMPSTIHALLVVHALCKAHALSSSEIV